MSAKSKSARSTKWRLGDIANAVLAVGLAGLAYWQSEVGLQIVREQLDRLQDDVGVIRRDVAGLQRHSDRSAQTLKRLDGVARDLQRAQRNPTRRNEAIGWAW